MIVKNILEKWLRWGNLALIAATLLTYIVPQFDPKTVGWLSVSGLFYPALLFGNIAMGLFWLVRRQFRLVLLSVLTILLGLNYLTASFGIHYGKMPETEQELFIGTYNVQNFAIHAVNDPEILTAKIDKALRFYDENALDIFCIQDLNIGRNPEYWRNKAIMTHFKGRHFVTNNYRLHIVSKYPIINQETVVTAPDKVNDLSCLAADIKINNDLIVRVYNIHLESNNVTEQAEKFTLDPAALQRKSVWRTAYHTLRSIKNQQQSRVLQMNAILEHIESCPYPVILCGDFNDTPVSHTHFLIRKHLDDTFSKRGRGKSSTYNGRVPFLKIDHILVDKKFTTRAARVHRNYDESDHFPVSTVIGW